MSSQLEAQIAGPDPTLDAAKTTTRIPFRGPFFREVARRKRKGKDAKITVTSANAETGVGKTHLSYYLALALDTSPTGFVAEDKATTDVQEFINLYDKLRKGSAMILDEGEQIDSRRSMAQENVDAALAWQTRRVNEITAILSLPTLSALDKRMRELQDYWVQVERRGACTCYKKQRERFGDGIWWQELQSFEWPNMDGSGGIFVLDNLKEDLIGRAENTYVSKEEAEKAANKKAADSKKSARNEFIRRQAESGEKHSDIVEKVEEIFGDELSQPRISQIANGDGS